MRDNVNVHESPVYYGKWHGFYISHFHLLGTQALHMLIYYLLKRIKTKMCDFILFPFPNSSQFKTFSSELQRLEQTYILVISYHFTFSLYILNAHITSLRPNALMLNSTAKLF